VAVPVGDQQAADDRPHPHVQEALPVGDVVRLTALRGQPVEVEVAQGVDVATLPGARLRVVRDVRADRDVLVEPPLDLVELLVEGLALLRNAAGRLAGVRWMNTTRP
jgi:hypothetical protein